MALLMFFFQISVVGLVLDHQIFVVEALFLSIFNFGEWGVGPLKRKGWVGMIYVEKTLIQLELKYVTYLVKLFGSI